MSSIALTFSQEIACQKVYVRRKREIAMIYMLEGCIDDKEGCGFLIPGRNENTFGAPLTVPTGKAARSTSQLVKPS